MDFSENLFNLKFAVKELERNSKKCEKEEKAEKLKCKKAIQKGNLEGARIHAENAIRQKNQALNYLRMSARVDAVASRVQTALTTRKVYLYIYLKNYKINKTYHLGHPIHGWCCQGDGLCHEVDEPRKNLHPDGQV
jgi:hypothetical protein